MNSMLNGLNVQNLRTACPAFVRIASAAFMRTATRSIVIGVLCLLSLLPCRGEENKMPSNDMSIEWSAQEGKELIGQQAPEFSGLKWLNTPPLSMQSLHGKVVLIRFWLIDCPLCSGSAQALNEIYEKYRNKGVVVIGIHHPKSEPAHN